MISKKKCLERVSNVSYGSLENAPKKIDDTLFHFFDLIWFWDKIFWSLFSSLDFNNHFFYYMFTEPFTRGIDSTSEHFSKLWELWWKYYMLHVSRKIIWLRDEKKTRDNLPFNTHLCGVCLRALKISDELVKNCIFPLSFLLSTHTFIIL